MDRTILHVDMNNCYASIMMLYYPKLRGNPVAVGGDVEKRHGIILARNYESKEYGVRVGQTLWEAKQKCPSLIIVPPDYDKFPRHSRLLRELLSEYSDQVEPFGLDESWVDVTGSASLFGDGEHIANEIRERVKFELGVTVSVGVSYNKIFSKLGSDIKKPDATTIITPENYKEVVWKLPASDLLGVGLATKKVFKKYSIRTIGDIAKMPEEYLQYWFGKWGIFLHCYANGMDTSPVKTVAYEAWVKSIGNSTTCPRDLQNEQEAYIVFYNLAESVSARMRDCGLKARTVQISLRTNDLLWCDRQMTLEKPTMITPELVDAAMELLRKNFRWEKPLRSIGIRGTNLIPISGAEQLTMFSDEEKREKLEKIEYAVDGIRKRFGYSSIGRAILSIDEQLGKIDAKVDHAVHPIGYL